MSEGITQLASGRWRWRIMVGGQRLSGTADTKPAARLARAQAAINVGATPDHLPTVRELVDNWIAEADHAASTRQRRDIAIDAIPDTFMARRAGEVTPHIVAALWRQMRDNGTGAHTILKASHVVSRAYRLGIKYGLVDTNPVTEVRPRVDKAKRIEPPTPADVRKVLERLADRHDVHTWATIMATVGARPGEICALTRQAVDDKEHTIYLGPSADRHGNVTPGKNGPDGHRVVNVTARLILAIRGVQSVPGSPYVFTRPSGLPWRPEFATKLIAAAATEVGVKMRPYDLRHFAATHALAAGRPVPEVARMLGDNPATVLKVYAHAIPNDSRSVEAVERALFG